MRYNYGRQIERTVFSDHVIRTKNRFFSKHQGAVLRKFADYSHPSTRAGIFSKIARLTVGAFLYSIKIELNDSCNLACKMCYVPPGRTELPKETLFKLFNQVKSQGVRIELLGGEPLMRRDITEIISYAKQEAKIPFLTIYTNGTYITGEMAQALKKAGVDAVLVTLISSLKEVHDNFTGIEGAWERSVSGIKELLKAGVPTYTFTSLHSENYKEYREIYRYVKQELKAHALFYQYIPQAKDDPLMIDPVEWHAIKLHLLTGIAPRHMEFVRDFYLLTGNACSGGNYVLTIKVDGSVQPCPFISDLPLGNIYSNDIWSIYRRRFRNTGLGEFKSLPAECSACAYRSVCGGGCKAGNTSLGESYSCMDHRCLGPFKKGKEKEMIMSDIPTFF